MKDYLKEYKATLKVIGPVFVGSGKELSKKEYLFLEGQSSGYQGYGHQSRGYSRGSGGQSNKKIGVIDINRFYAYAARKGKRNQYEEFLLSTDRRMDFSHWLMDNRMSDRDVKPYLKYELECGDTVLQRGTAAQVMECIKDPYGDPYIPGSSLKGMLRTILLCYRILNGTSSYDQEKYNIQGASGRHASRISYLKRECSAVEQKAFHTLNRPNSKPNDAVNDELSGFIVSDSEPLSINDIVLCQKVEGHVDGSMKRLNLLRECIKPGTEIYFTITIDGTRCHVDMEGLKQAIAAFDDAYYQSFLKAFEGTDRLKGNVVYLGGGSGYLSKTYIYPLFGKREGIKVAQNVFQNTLPPRVASEHKHSLDQQLGVSPHVLKYTSFNRQVLQFGQCEFSIN